MSEGDSVDIPLAWIGLDDAPMAFANQFVIQQQAGEFVLSIGQLAPPMILGRTDDERRAQIEALEYVPIRTVAKLAMTPQRMRELVAVLSEQLEKYDAESDFFGPPNPEAP